MTDQPLLSLGERIGIRPEDRVTISYYNDSTEWTPVKVPLKLADALTKALTAQQQNVYLMVNETVDQMRSKRGVEADVTRLRAIWADLDVKDGGMPSYDAARSVIDMLSDVLSCRPTAIVHSGHGLQPYWEVEDGDLNEGNRPYVAGLLRAWGFLVQRFAEVEGGKADSVYDLPRVLRAPGSVNFKHVHEPVPSTMEVNEWTRPLSLDEIEDAVRTYGFEPTITEIENWEIHSHPETWEPAEVNCMWAQTIASQISNAKPDARHPWLVAMATKIESAARNSCVTDETYGELTRMLEAKFGALLAAGNQPRALAPGEVNTAFKWARARVAAFSDVKFRAELDYHQHRGLVAVPDLPFASDAEPTSSDEPPSLHEVVGSLALAPQQDLVPIVLGDEVFHYTEAANAERLAMLARNSHIYVPGIGWHVWESGKYVKDEEGSIVRKAIQSMRDFAEEDPSPGGLAHVKKSMSGRGIGATVKLAESVPEIVVRAINLDADPMVLCTPGGIVDLHDGGIRPAQPSADYHTRQTNVTPQFGPMPRFEAFLQTTFGGTDETAERIRYIQKLLGIALIGEIRVQILPIFAGSGANGKSALMDIAAGCLGTYAATMPENFLLESSKLEHSTEIMRLRGIRVAIASETRPDGKFNESRVKMLTGETRLSARGMRQDFVDFTATHSIFLLLNHPPQVKNGGDSFWRRARKVDFLNVVPEADRVEGLAEQIVEEEGPAILQWMIEGTQLYLEEGLSTPLSVEVSTLNYRAEEDHIDSFLQDCTSAAPEAAFTVTALYATYMGWCKKNGEVPIASVALVRDLKSRMNLTPWRSKSARGYKGLLVYEDFGESDSSAPGMKFGHNGG